MSYMLDTVEGHGTQAAKPLRQIAPGVWCDDRAARSPGFVRKVQCALSADATGFTPNNLEPDRGQIATFVDALFRHAGTQGFVSLRAFYENANETFRITPIALVGGRDFLIDAALDDAHRAATFPKPVVFAPILAVFASKDRAREEDIALGLTLSVELDENPQAACKKLELLLGPATAVVASGGEWIDGEGVVHPKLHIHWRLEKAAQGDALVKLKRAREIACLIAHGDPTAKTIVHPMRWPGSWHRKAAPVMSRIVTLNADREIDLEAALAALGATAEARHAAQQRPARTKGNGAAPPDELQALADQQRGIGVSADPADCRTVRELIYAMDRLPNDDRPRNTINHPDGSVTYGWDQLGAGLFTGTDGSDEGCAAYKRFSAKSVKHGSKDRSGRTPEKRWRHWRNGHSRPQITAGTVYACADQDAPGWRAEYLAMLEAEAEAENEEVEARADTTKNANTKTNGAEAKTENPGGDTKTKSNESQAKTANTKSTPPPHGKTSEIIRASDIVMRAKVWLWSHHLLIGALELLTGIPGLGKSQVHCCYHACVTAGRPWPDGAPGITPMNTIMLTAEDTLDDEVVPRLIAAGAALDRVHIIKSIKIDNKGRQFLLAEDLGQLERDIARIGDIGLVTIDPITAFLGGKIDAHKTTEVRSQLGPVKDLAERSKVAFSAVTHPAKNASQKAIDHFIGSQAFIAAARLAHICVREMDEEGNETGRILFAHAKHNPTTRQPTLAYRLAPMDVGQDQTTGEVIAAPRVVWDKESVNISADAALAAASGKGDGRRSDDLDTARTMLADMLRDGPRRKTEIDERMAQLGIGDKSVRNAKDKLKVETRRKKGAWWWALPGAELPLEGGGAAGGEV